MQNKAYSLTIELINDFLSSSKTFAEFKYDITHNFIPVLETQKISVEKNIDEIRRGIVDFFYQYGLYALVIFQKNPALKITLTIKNRSENLYTYFLINWIEDQNPKELTPEFFESIFGYIKSNFDFEDILLYRDIARGAIKKYFKLSLRDSLFFKNFDFFVKKFDYDFVQINQELRSIKRLDTAVLLNENDRNRIIRLLKHTDMKKYLILSAQQALKEKNHHLNTNTKELCETFLDLVAQHLRLLIGKVLNSQIPSLHQTCFAEEYIRTNKHTTILLLAKNILQNYHYKEAETTPLMMHFDNRIKNNNPKFKTSIFSSSYFYTNEMIKTITKNFFLVQEKIDTLKQKIQKLDDDLKQKDQQIDTIQQEAKIKETILQDLNLVYENKKKSIKEQNLSAIEEEALSTSLSNFINEKKFILEDLEKIAQQIDLVNKEKTQINNDKKDIQEAIQQIHFKSQSQEKDFNLLAQAFSDCLLQDEI
ncbi:MULTISPECIES: coiled-coil domain-containing protein [unclassified Helicobacter]|uniref:coiled-coil domain-containing protein n=1 Tax=unclassified Helicobacter TaxID=2593540 RepID=UPI000CF0CC78|nr:MULTISPECIES: hypothetical protein [unclassified Helicobacter]